MGVKDVDITRRCEVQSMDLCVEAMDAVERIDKLVPEKNALVVKAYDALFELYRSFADTGGSK